MSADRQRTFLEISLERENQIERWGEQHHPDGSGAFYSRDRDAYRQTCDSAHQDGYGTWRDIALEELFEALSESDTKLLRKELIQTAAVIVAWIEDIDSREE